MEQPTRLERDIWEVLGNYGINPMLQPNCCDEILELFKVKDTLQDFVNFLNDRDVGKTLIPSDEIDIFMDEKLKK